MVQASQRAERAPAIPRRRSGSRLNALVPYLFIGPAMLIVLLLVLTPLGRGDQELVWLGDPLGAWSVVVLASTWGRYPFAFLMFLAGLQSIPRELYEAAMVDGAGRIQRFWFITIPRLWFISLIVGL